MKRKTHVHESRLTTPKYLPNVAQKSPYETTHKHVQIIPLNQHSNEKEKLPV